MAEKGHIMKRNSTAGPRNKLTGKHAAPTKPSTTKNPESESSEPISRIPLLKTQNNKEKLPKIHTALSRSQSDLVPADELDGIQLELEMLLSTVALRYRVLKSELESIDKADERKDRKNITRLMEKPPISPGKRKRPESDDKVEKKIKMRESSSGKVTNHQTRMAKYKNSAAPSPASQNTDDSSDTASYSKKAKDNPKVPRNDTPKKFWLSVEPYCMPVTQEDLRLLEDLIEEYSGPILPPIPDLGPHYAAQWGIEDIRDDQDISSPIAVKTRSGRISGDQNGEVVRVLRNSKKIMGEGVTGPLTQRLVSALMEENLLNDSNTAATTTAASSTENSNSSLENIPNNSNMVQTRSTCNLLKNGISIEKRVRKELIEQGILDAEDAIPPQALPDDEILSEIKRVRTELMANAEFNTSELLKLQAAAKEEMKRLDIKRKLDDVDQEIIEMHKQITVAKQKKRQLTQDEKDDVLRLANKQKKLADQLESFTGLGPNHNLNYY